MVTATVVVRIVDPCWSLQAPVTVWNLPSTILLVGTGVVGRYPEKKDGKISQEAGKFKIPGRAPRGPRPQDDY